MKWEGVKHSFLRCSSCLQSYLKCTFIYLHELLRVYTLRKDLVIIERMGTIAASGIFQPIVKISICTLILTIIRLFPTWHECLLLSISLFATENFYLLNNMGESGMSFKKIIVMQSESLTVNIFLIIVSYTFHPYAT